MITWTVADALPPVDEFTQRARQTVLSRMRHLVQEMAMELDLRGLKPAQRAPLDRHVARCVTLVEALPAHFRARDWKYWRDRSPRELLEKLLTEG